MKNQIRKIFLVSLSLFLIIAPTFAAEVPVVIKVGEDITFTEFNFHNSCFFSALNNPFSWPDTREAVASGNFATVDLTAYPRQSVSANATTGLLYQWDFSCVTQENVQDIPVTVIVEYTYQIEVSPSDSGTATIATSLLDWGCFDTLGLNPGSFGVHTNHRIESYHKTIGNLENPIAFTSYAFVNNAHDPDSNPEDFDIHNTGSSVTIDSICLEFPDNPQGTISFDQTKYTDINGCTRLKVIDPSLNNPNKPDEVTVTITSLDTVTHELVQKDLVLYEEGINSGIFTNAFVYNPPLSAGIWVSTANPGAFSATYYNAKEPAIANYIFSGSIKGRVWKGIWENGNIKDLVPVENAQVYAYKSGAHAGKEVYTNAQGLFIIDSLEPGTYEVTANFDGSNNVYKRTVEVKINQVTWLDFPSNIEGILKAITKSNAAQNYIRLRQAYMEHSWSVYRIGLAADFARLLMGINEIAAQGAYDLYSHLYGTAMNQQLGISIENAKDRADQAIAQLEKYIADPPDPHYNETYQVCATAQIDLPPEYQGTLLGNQISLTNALANQTAVDDALLESFERYQGALDAGDLDSVYLQLNALERYSSWLKTNSTVLENRSVDFRNIILSEKLAHESDLDALHQKLATEGINQTERDQLKSLNMTDEDIDLYQEILMNLSYDELLGSAEGFIEYAQNRSAFAHTFELQINDIRIQINQMPHPPVANFTANITSGAAPLTVQFNDTSTDFPTNWTWNFGDTGSSIVQNPVYTYCAPGTYTISLTITNASRMNTTVITNYVTVFPKGDFNTNWRVDIGDVTRVAYMAVGLTPINLDADFDHSGSVEVGDAARIAWYYVGKVAIL